jgi:hypothetical protein
LAAFYLAQTPRHFLLALVRTIIATVAGTAGHNAASAATTEQIVICDNRRQGSGR